MATATKVKTNKRANGNSKVKAIKKDYENLSANNPMIETYGEIVYWNVPGSRSMQSIAVALQNSGLPVNTLREIYPATAFARIANQLREEGIFDRLDKQGKEIVFQVTEKAIVFNHNIGEKEVEFNRKAFLRLDTELGTVSCQSFPELAKRIEDMIKNVQSQRTATEIGYLIKRLIDDQIDVFPLREGSSGVYFAPETSKEFLDKIANFCTELGSTLHRIPMVKGSDTKKSVADAVEIGINQMIKDHLTVIERFDVESNRADTIKKQFDNLARTQGKIMAYSSFLQEKAEILKGSLDDARALIQQKLDEMNKLKSESLLCTVKVSSNKCLIWGWSISKTAKYLRFVKNWEREKIVKLCKNLFGKRICGPSIDAMACINKGYEDVSLTDKQLQQLDDIACTPTTDPICESDPAYVVQGEE